MEQNKRICYICGYIFEKDIDKFDVCDCCLFQYGIDDTNFEKNSILYFRDMWINSGLPFCGQIIENSKWNYEVAVEQLNNLEFINIDYYPIKNVINSNNEWDFDLNYDLIKKKWEEYRNRSSKSPDFVADK